jgi:hypothetical protein
MHSSPRYRWIWVIISYSRYCNPPLGEEAVWVCMTFVTMRRLSRNLHYTTVLRLCTVCTELIIVLEHRTLYAVAVYVHLFVRMCNILCALALNWRAWKRNVNTTQTCVLVVSSFFLRRSYCQDGRARVYETTPHKTEVSLCWRRKLSWQIFGI